LPDTDTPLNVVVDLVETYFGWQLLVAGVSIIVVTISSWRKQLFLYPAATVSPTV
jgi:hypothetical protein